MKNFKFLLFSIFTALVMAACAPQEFDKYSLGDSYTISPDQFSFDMTPGSDEFTYNFVVTFNADPVKHPFTYDIRFGDGKADKSDLKNGLTYQGTHEYIVLKGTYTAQCIVYVPNGDLIIKEKVITFANDNEKIYQDDPASPQFALTGGKDNNAGKIWFLGGGSGLGPGDGTWGAWWDFGGTEDLFDDEFTFLPNSIKPDGKFIYNSNGGTFMNESLGSLFPDGITTGSFVTTAYTPPADANWEITLKDGKYWLTINKGFIGYAITPNDLNKTEYEILSFSPLEVHLKYYASDGNAWFFFLTSTEPEEVINLTGGKDSPQGKAWQWRSSDDGAGVVMTRTWTGEVWWKIDNTAVGSEAAYNDILTFYADGSVKYENQGDSFISESAAALFSDGKSDGSFVTTEYIPSTDASWSFTTIDEVSYLSLQKVFPMYGLDVDLITTGGNYEIVELTSDLLHIKYVSGTGEWDVTWNFYLVPVK